MFNYAKHFRLVVLFQNKWQKNTGITGNIDVPSSPLRGSAPHMFEVKPAFMTYDFHWASASALIISLVT